MQMISSPAIAQDGTRIFVGSWSGKLYAIDPFGQLKWTFTTGNALVSPIIAPNGNIIVGSMDKSVYALDQLGNKLWSYATPAAVSYFPAIAPDGTIYIGPRGSFGAYTDNSLFYALNSNGTLKWSYDTRGRPHRHGAGGRERRHDLHRRRPQQRVRDEPGRLEEMGI